MSPHAIQQAPETEKISSSFSPAADLQNASRGKEGLMESAKSIDGHSSSTGLAVSYPQSKMKLGDRPIDEVRKLRVAVIGAGIAGITAGILLPAKVPGIELTIIEKNEDVGGTWLENKYVGVRCDIPSHIYQSTFLPNPQWSDKFAAGEEILAYWKHVARTFDVYRFIRFRNRVNRAEWDAENSKWDLNIFDTRSNKSFKESYDVVLTAIGRFNAWRLPEYPGMEEFQGYLTHSANWDPSFNPSGKRVAVIGNGASGIQLVPGIQKVAARLDHYARSRTWIAGSFAGDERTVEPQPFTPEELEAFKDPQRYLEFRKMVEGKHWRTIKGQDRNSKELADMRTNFVETMRRRLQKKPELLEKMIPDFAPNCRRLTPGPGYLEALCEDNVDFIQDRIRRLTKTGIETEDGTVREVDAVICATGFNIDFAPPFPIVAFGKDLNKAWKPGGQDGFPKTYLGLAAPGIPNLLFIGGPHAAGASGTQSHSIETQISYHAKVLRKISGQGIKTMSPSLKAVDDFIDYADAYFPTTPLTDHCSSWANGGKPGNRIHGAWPGSAAHMVFVRRDPRWEDWEYEYLTPSGNRFAYLGNGRTLKEADPESDMTPYLKLPSEIDFRDIHESWWNWP